jgi:hypothetical protein
MSLTGIAAAIRPKATPGEGVLSAISLLGKDPWQRLDAGGGGARPDCWAQWPVSLILAPWNHGPFKEKNLDFP